MNRPPSAHPETSPARAGLVALAGICALAVAIARPLAAQEATGAEERDTATARVYLDETARHLVVGARAARDSALSEIDSYTAIVRERGSVEVSVLVRDRPVARFESATRVRWSRDGPTVLRVLGSRADIGGRRVKPPSPEGIAARFAADPLRDPFSLFIVSEFGSEFRQSWLVPSVTPLDEDAERFYQFRSGDTITVTLAGGASVRAVAVTASPRFANLGLVFAAMWIEPETFGVVRTIYRPAKSIMDSEMSFRVGGDWDGGIGVVVQSDGMGNLEARSPSRPSLLDRILNYGYDAFAPRMELGVSVVVVDYALWNLRHWLPRRASFARYAMAGDDMDAEYSEMVTANGLHDWDFEIEEISTGGAKSPDLAASAEELVRAWREDGDTVEVRDESEPDAGTVVIMPRDWRARAASDLLPPSIWEERESGIYAGEIEEAGEVLDAIGMAGLPADPENTGIDRGISPWSLDPPVLAPALMRYNPVEGLSVGTRVLRDFPWGRGALTVRTATRRTEPNVDFTVEHGESGPRVRFSLYHTLRETGGRVAGRRPQRLEFGADSSWYYVARGAALQLLPARDERFWTSLRLFSETTTTLSGDSRRRTGADVHWRPWWGGLTGTRVNGGADVSLQGLVGDFPSVRLSVMGGLVIPLPAGLSVALEAGGANIWGDPAPEEIWRLGGSGDWLRGYPGVVLRGREVWRSRAELQRKISLLSVSVFHDWASVDGGGLQSAGVGISIFNGFVRADLGRPLSPWYEAGGAGPHAPKWRGHLRAFAPF